MIALDKFIDEIDGEVLTKGVNPSAVKIEDGYVCDLLSDVMGNALENQVWITIMRHLNVIAVASLTGIPAVIFPKGIIPESAVSEKAEEEGICLVSSDLSSFEIAGKLFKILGK
ncbi:MAG: hypothetical protein CSB55_08280 [Candidatus Cloacimonadota bacterium]|nr:MAG: hypothetical protein CSB55_08280 [Candidatus Cloacimonadota bacterium]